MKRRIAIKISYEAIVKFLGLPENCEMQELIQSSEDKLSQTFSVIIKTPDGYKIPEGKMIPFVNLELFLEDLRNKNE
jgi:plasmid replication initiation protein